MLVFCSQGFDSVLKAKALIMQNASLSQCCISHIIEMLCLVESRGKGGPSRGSHHRQRDLSGGDHINQHCMNSCPVLQVQTTDCI